MTARLRTACSSWKATERSTSSRWSALERVGAVGDAGLIVGADVLRTECRLELGEDAGSQRGRSRSVSLSKSSSPRRPPRSLRTKRNGLGVLGVLGGEELLDSEERVTSDSAEPSLAMTAAPSSDSNPAMRRLFSTRPRARRVHQKREAAKDKRWNKAREFGVNGVRAHRANHEGDQGRRSGLSPLGNQHTEPTEDFQHSDDILSVCGVAPIHEPFGPSDRRGAFEFQSPDDDKCHSQENGARPYRCPGKRNHCAPPIDIAFSPGDVRAWYSTIQRTRFQLTRSQFRLSTCHTRRI